MADTETLDDLVRRVDPDRWLASRFIADPAARADVIALYAFNYELARVAGGVSNALMGEIRLTWWREAMEEIADGKTPRKHPNVEAIAVSGIDPLALAAMAQARFADLDDAPPADEGRALAIVGNAPTSIEAGQFFLDMIPKGDVLVIHNEDQPGVVGTVGGILGKSKMLMSLKGCQP